MAKDNIPPTGVLSINILPMLPRDADDRYDVESTTGNVYSAINHDWRSSVRPVYSARCTREDGAKIVEKFRTKNPSIPHEARWDGPEIL